MNSTSLYMIPLMNSTTITLIHFFLLSLAFGTQLFTPVVSTRLTGVGFYKLATSIVLASLGLGLATQLAMEEGPATITYWFYGFLLLTHGFGHIFHRDHKGPLMWALYVLQLIVFVSLIFYVFNFSPTMIQFFFLSSAMLGISNYGMILGHYYLVVPKLTVEPLIYCLYLFWMIIFFKITFSLSNIFSVAAPYLEEGTRLGDGYMFNWLFISMRYLWGYLAPLILSLFTYRLCRLQSTQSATGVLYIIEFFVIVGELIGSYLMIKHGLAL